MNDCLILGAKLPDKYKKFKRFIDNAFSRNDDRIFITRALSEHNKLYGWAYKQDYVKTEEEFINTNGNVLKKWFRQYLNEKKKDVTRTESKKKIENQENWTSVSAKRKAIVYTGQLLKTEYYSNVLKNAKLNKNGVIRNVRSTVFNTFMKKANSWIESVKSENIIDEKSYKDYKELKDKISELGKDKKLTSSQVKEKQGYIEDLYTVVSSIVNKYGDNDIIKNYYQLTLKTRSAKNYTEWFNEVFNDASMYDLYQIFEGTNTKLEKSYNVRSFDIEGNDISNDDDYIGTLDSLAATWDNKLNVDYLEGFDDFIKLYLSVLPERNASIVGLGNEGVNSNYAYDPELGVVTFMDLHYVINQLSILGPQRNVNHFIESIERKANTIPSLYGLGKLANDMRNNPVFANRVYCNFAKPILNKIQITVSEDIAENDLSNDMDINPSAKLYFQLASDSNLVGREEYLSEDARLLDNALYSIVKLSKDSDLLEYDDKLNQTITIVTEYIKKHFPSLNIDTIIDWFFDNPNTANRKDLISLIKSLKSYNEGLRIALENENKYNSEYYKERRDYAKSVQAAEEMGEKTNRDKPVYDGESINRKQRNDGIFDIIKVLKNTLTIDPKLNSTNAENKMASNIGKSSYITDFVKQLKVSLENGKNGSEIVKEFFTKKKYDITDVESNIFLFGLKDRNGNTIIEGLLTKNKVGEYIVNENSNIIKTFDISLFDGIRNNSSNQGTTYDKMSKEDYLLSSLLIYNSSLQFENMNETDGDNMANFLMRIPSDASNTYCVQMQKISASDLYDYGNIQLIDNKISEIENNLRDYLNDKKTIKSKKINGYWRTLVNQLIKDNYKINSNNRLNDDDMLNLLLNGYIEDISLTNINSRTDKNEEYIPFVYNDKKTGKSFVVLTKGQLSDNKTFVERAEIVSIRSIQAFKNEDKEMISYFSNLYGESFGESEEFAETQSIEHILNNFINKNNERVKNWMYENNIIDRTYNKNSKLFLAFRSQLWGEIQQFVTNLNNVFERDENGQYVTKSSLDNLIDNFHYKTSIVDDDGKLTGNIFKFTKLFNVRNFDVNSAIEKFLALYTVTSNSYFKEPLFISTDNNKLMINPNRIGGFINEFEGKDEYYLTVGDDFQSNQTQVFSDQLDNIISQWLGDVYDLTLRKENEFNSILSSKYNNHNNLFEWALNSSLAYITFDGIFEGSGKYYKNPQTFLKRAKETQMGGTPYAGSNFGIYEDKIQNVSDITGQEQVIKLNVNGKNLLDETPTYVNGQIVKKPLTLRNGFRAVTIKNSATFYDNYEEIWKTIYDNTLKEIGNKESAKNIADKIAFAYGRPYIDNKEKLHKPDGTKANDAQSYITIEEFIRRRQADGTINDYIPLLSQLLDPNVKAEDINYDEVSSKIQAQKNVYFDLVYDEYTGQHRPRQIKNAEFVLIPKLLPKESSLYQLYDIMRNHDIGQVNTLETSKASNKNVIEFWDDEGNANPLKFEASLTGMELKDGKLQGRATYPVVEDFYYKHLYKQLDVVDHIEDKENKAGIQIFKKIQDNYTDETKDYVNNIQEAFSANIKNSYNRLIKKLGWKIQGNTIVNKDGTKQLNFEKFYDLCLDEFRRIGLDDNVIDYLVPENTGSPLMPEWMSIIATKLENVAQSVFNNNITRQTLPGYHGIQISNIGFSRKLRYYPVEEGVIQPVVEIMIPPYSDAIKKLIKKYGKKEAIERLNKALLDKHIGYRIPTEGKQSVAVFKIVDFLDESYGSSIIVPNEWVTQTGSDFDIDSIYAIVHEMYFDGTDIHKVEYNVGTKVTDIKERYLDNLKIEVNSADEEIKKLYNENKDNFDKLLDIGDKLEFYYEDFAKLTPIEQLTERQRNNFILDQFINIMSNSSSREEVFGRSNFDDLTNSKNNVENISNTGLKNTSIYNPFDQLSFMQNAIDGRKLKAISVNRDTLCSICNKSKAVINNVEDSQGNTTVNKIRVIYDNSYDINIAKSAYEVQERGDKFIITHDKFGWSKNNRNVVGRLITSYSSQTTAHILDAIKEGALFNETEFTFGTFKTLIDVGIDYDTAVTWLYQPVITRINNINNSVNSIYLNEFNKPVYHAILQIAKELGVIPENVNFIKQEEILNKIITSDFKDTYYSILKNVFDSESINDTAINKQAILNRLQGKDVEGLDDLNPVKIHDRNLIFDLISAFQFNRFYNTTQTIENVSRCLRPDSFGSKQIIKQVVDLVDDVDEYRKNKTLTSNDGRTLIDSIYTDDNSNYKYLYYFYKYSTLASKDINTQLFKTEQPHFKSLLNDIKNKKGNRLSDEEYMMAKKYLIHLVYDSVPLLSSPIKIDEHGFAIVNKDSINNDPFTPYWETETGRIYGFIENEVNVPNIDINNPTQEDIVKFSKLTPAQKVLFIKSKYNDVPFINRVEVVKSFKNELTQKKYSYNRLFINSLSNDIDFIRREFSTIFFNKDILVRMTAIDLLKYAFVVEGYDFRKNYISRCIPNEVIIAKVSDGGLGILEGCIANFDTMTLPKFYELGTTDNFIRANSNILKPKKISMGSSNDKTDEHKLLMECYDKDSHLIKIPKSQAYSKLLTALGFENSDSNYIKLTFNATENKYKTYTYLYKVINSKFLNEIYLIPINLLEPFENQRYSVNPANNEHYDYSYYIQTIKDSIELDEETLQLASAEQDIDGEEESVRNLYNFINSSNDNILKELPKYKFKNQNDENKLINSLSTADETHKVQLYKFFNDINNIISKPELTTYIVENSSLAIQQLLNLKGDLNSGIFNIPKDDSTIRVKISRYNTSALIKYQNRKNKKSNNSTFDYYLDAFGDIAGQGKKFYKIDVLSEETVDGALQEYDGRDSKYDYGDEVIDDSYTDSDAVVSQTLASLIAKDIRKSAYKDDEFAVKANSKFLLNGIILSNTETFSNRTQTVYSIANQYYKKVFDALNAQINNFEMINGETYSIDDSELFKNATPEDFNNLLSLVLKANHFAETLRDIYDFDMAGEDVETQKEIELLKGYVSAFKNNTKLKIATNKIFNKYLTQNVSRNPLLKTSYQDSRGNKHYILDATDIFGDSGFLTAQISDIGNIPHKQIQMVVKAVNETINEATFDGREKVHSYEKWIKENIGTEQANTIFNKIIDEDGRIIRPYTDKFIEDKYKIKDELRNIELTYGKYSKEYFEKELESRKWALKNTEQQVLDDYYRKYIDLLEETYKDAGELLIKYRGLVYELYNVYGDTYNLTEAELREKERINDELAKMLSETDEEGNKKSEEELNAIDAVKQYKQELAYLNDEYFESKATKEFEENLKHNLSIIKEYDRTHKNFTLQEKLEDIDYLTAYNWVRSNTRYRLNNEALSALGKAYEALKLGNPIRHKNARINAIFEHKKLKGELYDIYGTVIGTNFTEDEIKTIRDIQAEKYSPVEGHIGVNVHNEDSALYKNIPETRILSTSFWLNHYVSDEEKNSEIIDKKKKDYSRINEIIAKGINHDTGVIEARRLFDNCTQDELDELVDLYDELRGLYVTRDKKDKKEKVFEYKRNEAAFAIQYNMYTTFSKVEKRLFEEIFCEKDSKGETMLDKEGRFVPNGFLYGYVTISDKVAKEHPEYIDEKKEEALKLIRENEYFENTVYYYDAIKQNMKEAQDIYDKTISEGKSTKEAEILKAKHIDDWFANNHIWNKYTNQWQPISIWTVRRIKEDGTLPGSYEFEPIGDNFEREIRDGKENPNYSRFGSNYKSSTGDYNNTKYASIISNTDSKEYKLYKYIENLIWQYATNNTNRRFIEEGWAPRKYKVDKTPEWMLKQGLGTLGFNFRNYNNRTFTEIIDYEHDHDIVNPMLQLLKSKGYEELEKIPAKENNQTDEEYKALINEINARNDERRKHNMELEKSIRDDDWYNVFKNFIYSSDQYKARENVKDLIYLTLDDLRNRKAFKVNAFGKVSKNKNDEYLNIDQRNTVSVFENWARRILFGEYKELSKLNKFADTLQNMSSAKYMIFNVYAGINNVAVGMVNILGEIFAKDYFGNKEWMDATNEYRKSMLNFIKDTFSDKSSDRTVAIVKMFDAIEMDRMLEFDSDRFELGDIAKHFNTIAYSLQSGGEHFMQNSALIAILKSHRVYKDPETGKNVIGSFGEYVSGIENAALSRVISGDEYLTTLFNQLKANAKKDKQLQFEYDRLKRNIVSDFFNIIQEKDKREKYQKEYIALRKEMLKNDREEFNKHKSAWDCIEYKDGIATWSKESELTNQDLGFLRNRAIYVNKQIHGVYDKLGAAQIEKHWYGSLIMQFKKHIWPGIIKRYNTKGYYNEQRGNFEKGSYISVVDFLGTEFKTFKSRYTNKTEDQSANALAAIQTVFECIIDTIHNFKYNYELLPAWEQNNIRRALADLCGVMAALLTVFAIYGLTDDDDLKDNKLLNSTLYLADRLYGESRMYTPFGAIPEFNTQWQNPIAGKSVVEDLLKSMQFTTQWLLDPDYEPLYKSGPYKGKNKVIVTVKKNIPAVRTIQRISTINKSNKYYRIGDNSGSQKIVKSIAKRLRGDE